MYQVQIFNEIHQVCLTFFFLYLTSYIKLLTRYITFETRLVIICELNILAYILEKIEPLNFEI